MSQVKKIPMRKCVGCQEMKSKREMIRILKTESEGIMRSLKTGILPEIYDSLKKEIEKIESE